MRSKRPDYDNVDYSKCPEEEAWLILYRFTHADRAGNDQARTLIFCGDESTDLGVKLDVAETVATHVYASQIRFQSQFAPYDFMRNRMLPLFKHRWFKNHYPSLWEFKPQWDRFGAESPLMRDRSMLSWKLYGRVLVVAFDMSSDTRSVLDAMPDVPFMNRLPSGDWEFRESHENHEKLWNFTRLLLERE